ncbi:MAG: SCO family protein [Pseudomonadota bacterium]
MIRALLALLLAAAPAAAQSPFFLDITPRFALTDQFGDARTEADYQGKPMLIFFGYTKCESICTVALPAMADALDLLGEEAENLTPILITIDPKNDTPEQLKTALPDWHDDLIGLTGSEEALEAARDVFQIQREVLFETPYGDPVYAHGSFIYLTDKAGKVQSVLPPILGPERLAEIIRKQI